MYESIISAIEGVTGLTKTCIEYGAVVAIGIIVGGLEERKRKGRY
jgi:hypothetical protein